MNAEEIVKEAKKWQADALGARTVEALKKRNFDALYVPTKEEAAQKVLEFVQLGDTVGFGGSMTAGQMGLHELVEQKGAVKLLHDGITDPEEHRRVTLAAQHSDVYITSVNAMTVDGMLYNIDGRGNRVSAMIFGPKHVVIVAGINKIALNEQQAFERMYRYASPLNNKRLHIENPCAKMGSCINCLKETCICNAVVQLRRRPSGTPTTVIVIGEELGL